MLGIVESRADAASKHIAAALLDGADWAELADRDRADADGGGTYYRTDGAELRSFEALHLDLERADAAFECDPDLLVFASRHSGETGPLLTGHFTGNFGPAEFGGEDGRFAEAAPNVLPDLLAAFDEYAPEGYDVGTECTHHGPTDVGCPSLFVELGSGDEQWDDPAGAEAVARAVLDLRGLSPHRERTVVGFGGGHYVPRFERIVRETPWAVGHVGSEWALDAMGLPGSNRRVIERAFEESGAAHAVVEGDRPDLKAVIDDLGYRVVSERWLRAVGDRPLELVDRVERALGPIDEGVRFGTVGDAPGELSVRALPMDLLRAAEGIDTDRVRRLLEGHAVAFETVEGGTRIGRHAVLPTGAGTDDLLDGLLGVLGERYEEVGVDAGAVRIRETAFDPDLAREAGVPEGPAFGRLSNGETVEVDGEQVGPDAVHAERVECFPLPEGWD